MWMVAIAILKFHLSVLDTSLPPAKHIKLADGNNEGWTTECGSKFKHDNLVMKTISDDT